MKTHILFGTMALFAAAALAADSAKEDVKAAAKKLSSTSYSWKATTDLGGGGGGGGGRFRPGPTEGKADKDGTVHVMMTRGENKTEAVLKGTKGALKAQDGWKSLSEAAEDDGGGQPSPGRFIARMLQNYKTPAAQAEDLADKTKSLKKEGDVYSGELTEDGAKELMRFGGRGGGGPNINGAKGTAKFWVKDGALSKYEFNLQGKMEFNGDERDVNRTTTVEIKDVGTTTVTVPDEAKKKLS